MAKVHRALFDRFEARTVPAAIVDTPYGFQENADELSARTLEFFATSVGNPVEVASFRSRRRGRRHGRHRGRPAPRGPLRHGRARQPQLRAAAVGGDRHPGRARREARRGRDPDDGERGGPDAGRRDDPGLRDLQGRRRPGLARGPRPAGRGDRAAGRRRAPLRQRRGRHPRHALLLHGRAPAADPRGDAPRRRVRARRGQPHRARPGPRDRRGEHRRPGRRHGPGGRPEHAVRGRLGALDRGPR